MPLVAQQPLVIDRPFARYLPTPSLPTRKALIGLARGGSAERVRADVLLPGNARVFPGAQCVTASNGSSASGSSGPSTAVQKYLIRATPSWVSREAWLWRIILYR